MNHSRILCYYLKKKAAASLYICICCISLSACIDKNKFGPKEYININNISDKRIYVIRGGFKEKPDNITIENQINYVVNLVIIGKKWTPESVGGNQLGIILSSSSREEILKSSKDFFALVIIIEEGSMQKLQSKETFASEDMDAVYLYTNEELAAMNWTLVYDGKEKGKLVKGKSLND